MLDTIYTTRLLRIISSPSTADSLFCYVTIVKSYHAKKVLYMTIMFLFLRFYALRSKILLQLYSQYKLKGFDVVTRVEFS